MVDVAALVSKARAVFEDAKPVDQAVLAGDEALTVRLWPLEGAAWRELKAKFPPRREMVDGKQVLVAADASYGFNLDGVVAAYPRVKLVEDGAEVDVTPEEWASLCSVFAGPSLDALAMTVWGKNEFEPNQRLAAAGKASRAGRRKKPASPASSE